MSKRVHLRQGAVHDIEEIIDYYLGEAGAAVAGRFTDALEHAVQHLGDHPSSGSLRFAYELGLPDLRSWRLKGFPYLVFYRDEPAHADARAGRSGVPGWLGLGVGHGRAGRLRPSHPWCVAEVRTRSRRFRPVPP